MQNPKKGIKKEKKNNIRFGWRVFLSYEETPALLAFTNWILYDFESITITITITRARAHTQHAHDVRFITVYGTILLLLSTIYYLWFFIHSSFWPVTVPIWFVRLKNLNPISKSITIQHCPLVALSTSRERVPLDMGIVAPFRWLIEWTKNDKNMSQRVTFL